MAVKFGHIVHTENFLKVISLTFHWRAPSVGSHKQWLKEKTEHAKT